MLWYGGGARGSDIRQLFQEKNILRYGVGARGSDIRQLFQEKKLAERLGFEPRNPVLTRLTH